MYLPQLALGWVCASLTSPREALCEVLICPGADDLTQPARWLQSATRYFPPPFVPA